MLVTFAIPSSLRHERIHHNLPCPPSPLSRTYSIACEYGQEAAAELLLRYGADPNIPCASGSTPLVLACYKGEVPCARLLLDLPGSLRGPVAVGARRAPYAASPRISPSCGQHALLAACECLHESDALELVRELLLRDVQLAVVPNTRGGNVAAHVAAEFGSPRVLVSDFSTDKCL